MSHSHAKPMVTITMAMKMAYSIIGTSLSYLRAPRRTAGVPGARPPVVHAISAARHRGCHSGRHDALAISGDACEGRSDRETVRPSWPAFGSEGLHRSRRPDG